MSGIRPVSPTNCQEGAKIFSLASSRMAALVYTSVDMVLATAMFGSTGNRNIIEFGMRISECGIIHSLNLKLHLQVLIKERRPGHRLTTFRCLTDKYSGIFLFLGRFYLTFTEQFSSTYSSEKEKVSDDSQSVCLMLNW